jgi:hypothetical protein
MAAKKRASSPRFRVGRVSVYLHHGAWWAYYRDNGQQVRRKIAATRTDADQVAAQVNAQLANGEPTLLAFTPMGLPELRQQFLDYHEHVLKSSMSTVRRYRAATQHLEDFVMQQPRPPLVHQVRPDAFATYLRKIEVAPNGHKNTAKRRLRDKGIQFILETCRSMYNFASKRRHLPPYVGNPFLELPLDRLKIEDAKPIFVFDEATELAFFKASSAWAFPIHFTLAKTGGRGVDPPAHRGAGPGRRLALRAQQDRTGLASEDRERASRTTSSRGGCRVADGDRHSQSRPGFSQGTAQGQESSAGRQPSGIGPGLRRTTASNRTALVPLRGAQDRPACLVGSWCGEGRRGTEFVREDDAVHRPSRSDVPQVLAAFLCYAVAGRQRGPADPTDHPGALPQRQQRPGDDRQLHPHSAPDTAGTDRGGVATVARFASIRSGISQWWVGMTAWSGWTIYAVNSATAARVRGDNRLLHRPPNLNSLAAVRAPLPGRPPTKHATPPAFAACSASAFTLATSRLPCTMTTGCDSGNGESAFKSPSGT